MRKATTAAAVALAAAASAAPATSATSPAPCAPGGLTLVNAGTQGAAGTMFEMFRFVPRKGSCTMRGYPSVTLLGRHRKPLGIKVGHYHDDAHPVRKLVFSKGRPARFTITHPSFDPKTARGCVTEVWFFRVATPAGGPTFTVGTGKVKPRFCRARARVTPVGRHA